MVGSNGTRESLVVTTSRGDVYVIPSAALEQFCATAIQRGRIDEVAGAMVPGSYVRLRASDASVQSSFASVHRTTSLSWFQDI